MNDNALKELEEAAEADMQGVIHLKKAMDMVFDSLSGETVKPEEGEEIPTTDR